jgi:hypothetical protein
MVNVNSRGARPEYYSNQVETDTDWIKFGVSVSAICINGFGCCLWRVIYCILRFIRGPQIHIRVNC